MHILKPASLDTNRHYSITVAFEIQSAPLKVSVVLVADTDPLIMTLCVVLDEGVKGCSSSRSGLVLFYQVFG